MEIRKIIERNQTERAKVGNLLDNADAMEILRDAAEQLAKIGVFAQLVPTDVPSAQGLGVMLLAGCSLEAVAGLYVQAEVGEVQAHVQGSAAEVRSRVAEAVKDVSFRASVFGYVLNASERKELAGLEDAGCHVSGIL